MEKTVNQWIDLLDQLDYHEKNHIDVVQFRDFLLHIKLDEKYKNYGGMVKIELPTALNHFFKKLI